MNEDKLKVYLGNKQKTKNRLYLIASGFVTLYSIRRTGMVGFLITPNK